MNTMCQWSLQVIDILDIKEETMKVLIIGSGGREHAIAYALNKSPKVDEIHAIPGNPGIAQIGTCHPAVSKI